MRIRSAVAADLTVLPEIERSAGAAFHGVGMPEIAEDDPGSAEELDRYRRAGLAWVAVDGADRPVAYLVAEPVDGNLHIEQVSVHADHARRGIGRALIEHVAGYAAERGFPAVTLTTFTDVAWNAPYYRRLGFAELADAALGPELREIRAREAAHGLDRWPRCAMVRPV
ncbi:MAG: GNAT family N-acetyltransferase [Streptomycetaceae bacterium]|nr:GNAT family N-acetyltransferase [Streptomycetaceae bacterium]